MAAGRNVTTVDFGATPIEEMSFTVTDANITSAMIIEAFISGGDSTADNDAASHLHAAASFKMATSAGTGLFTLQMYSTIDLPHGTFKIQYAYST